MEILADILFTCKSPQTRTYIRRQTSIPYAVLQNCITQLLLRQWLKVVNENSGSTKLTITDKGLVFLEKWLELQKIMLTKNQHKNAFPIIKNKILVSQQQL
jgi:predicted transcriptional regulator